MGRWSVALILVLAACGDDGSGGGSSGGSATSGPSTTDPDTSEAGPSSSTASSSAATTDNPSTTTATTGGDACQSSDDCDAGQFCNWQNESCGVAGSEGACADVPADCTDDDRPVCACNDTLYPNDCAAAGAGQDVAFLGECTDPAGAFRCGFSYCISGDEYCLETVGIDPVAECIELPPVCQPPDCNCIATCCGCEGAGCCSDFCTNTDGDLTFSCPGE